MKRHIFAAAVAALAGISANAASSSDPVLMTVDGHDVPVSEFEYLYNKNNSQQLQQQSIDDYLQLFINYKLKVADAERAGLQNSPEFVSEYNNYRAELAAPYLRSQAVEDSLVQEAYSHREYDVYVSHIMLPMEPGNQQRADSLRTAILEGKTTFEDAARNFSVDRASSIRGGRMGYVVPDRFPWPFEKAAYDTAVGSLSPVGNSGMGYHIIRVESRQPAAGEVLASHILLMNRGKSQEEIEENKATIDSLYTLLKDGADFGQLALKYSEDPGSAQREGSLGWFGRGVMVAEFDSVAFSLANGEVSAPFETAFGYHIVKRFDHQGVPALDDVRKKIVEAMGRDERSRAPEEAKIKELLAKYNASVNPATMEKVTAAINANGGYDSTVIVTLAAMKEPLASYNGTTLTVAQVMEAVPFTQSADAATGARLVSTTADGLLRSGVLDLARADLEKNNADYRNLINEYRDGILLYEISNRKVWDRASKDTEGLEQFFKENAAKYAWEAPKFKSYVIFATSDSVLNEALTFAGTLSTDNPADFTKEMRKRFPRDIKIERVIAAKGENAITDYLGFGQPKPTEETGKWKAYAAFKGRILDAPEEAADVRGAAMTDYQSKLENDWIKELHKNYKVKVNNKVFKKLQAK